LSENVLPKNTAAPNTETMPIKPLPNSFVTECYIIDTKLFLTKIIVVRIAPKTPISWTPYRKMHYPDKKECRIQPNAQRAPKMKIPPNGFHMRSISALQKMRNKPYTRIYIPCRNTNSSDIRLKLKELDI